MKMFVERRAKILMLINLFILLAILIIRFYVKSKMLSILFCCFLLVFIAVFSVWFALRKKRLASDCYLNEKNER